MSGFLEEVQRRKVYRVAAAYIIAGGFIIQIGSAVFPAWDLPSWAFRLVVVLLLVGFPISLILAWAYDVTPHGIQATPKSAPGTHRQRNLIILIGTGVIISAAAGFFLLPRAIARKVDKSIAVLPFENFSDDKQNAYFADGIQDDILTNLSKIGDLKVISRTSVMSYRGKTQNVRDIGKALGVSTVLEGSVRSDGKRVRVNVQLIDATNDEHIWASDYDREVTDVFAIQTDLAQKIANELQARLSPSEKAMMVHRPTENSEAYLAVVQAHNLWFTAPEDFSKQKEGEKLYERAISLDPNFALAFARYSQLESWIVHSFESTAARRDKARSLAERSLQLQPDLPEGHLAMGFVQYYADGNYDAAAKEFEIALRGLPNEAEAYLAMGAIQRRQGNWTESTANLEKAASLNPNDTWPLQNLFFNYEMLRNYEAAGQTIDRALKINPKAFALWELKAKLAIEQRGDLSVAHKGLQALATRQPDVLKDNKVRIAQTNVLILERNYSEALRVAEEVNDEAILNYPGLCTSKYQLIGISRRALHDEAGAQAAFLKAKEIAEKQVKQDPQNANRHVELATALACLGEKEAAIENATRALELLPESKDAFEGPNITEGVAAVYGIVGETNRAIEMLDGLLSRPSATTVATLKLYPMWDPIRGDPRFQALIDKYSART